MVLERGDYPAPDLPRGTRQKLRLPIAELEVGWSFSAPSRFRATIIQVASALTRYTEKQFTVRQIDFRTVRVWRTR